MWTTSGDYLGGWYLKFFEGNWGDSLYPRELLYVVGLRVHLVVSGNL